MTNDQCVMNPIRQQKYCHLLQREFADIFNRFSKDIFKGTLITVTKINVTSDLSLARVNISIFGTNDKEGLLNKIRNYSDEIRRQLALRIRHQIRKIPAIEFYIDDTLDYIENIEKLLKK